MAQADDPQTPIATFPYSAFLPIVHIPSQPPPERFILEWDPRLTTRGAVLIPAKVTAGQGYWQLRKAYWLDEQEAGGRHHILVDILDDHGQRVTNITLKVAWADGYKDVLTEQKSGEPYSANYDMHALAPAYSAQPFTGVPADRVEGMGMGTIEHPELAAHTSYDLTWQWTIADSPAITQTATPTPTLTPTLTPTVTLTLTVTPTPTSSVVVTTTATPTPLLTPVPTLPAIPTLPPVPTLPPLARAVVVGCQPNDRGSRFEGYVYVNDQPVSGYRVVFSYEADGPWVTQPALSGNTPLGFYAHIISAGVARSGSWYAWLVDQNKQRISAIAAFTTDGEGGACNMATINFFK